LTHPFFPLIGEGISKSSDKRTTNLPKSLYEKGLGRSLLPDKIEKSENFLSNIIKDEIAM